MGDESAEREKTMSPVTSNIVLGDFEVLFSAVTARLRSIAHGSGESTVAPLNDADESARTALLECVSALDQLHVMVAHEVERREQLEQIVFDARTALAQAPPELVDVVRPALRVPPDGRSPWVNSR